MCRRRRLWESSTVSVWSAATKGSWDNMQMYEVIVLAEDMRTELQRKVLCAEDEDDALDIMQEMLEEENVAYGMCQASEI